MRERVLTARERNRAMLQRQLLLGRVRVGVPEALRRIAGIQAQYPPSGVLGLAARIDGFDRATLDRALARRSAVHATTIRGTIHLHAADDYWPIELLVRDRRRHAWLTMRKDVGEDRLAAAEATVDARLADGPAWRSELQELVGRDAEHGVLASSSLLRLPPSSTWERRRADLLGRAEDALGPSAPHADREAGMDLLVRRFLGAFGPSSRQEIAHWATLPMGWFDQALGRVAPRRLRDEDGVVLHDLPRAPLPAGDVRAPVRLLPPWDQTTLGPLLGRGACEGEARERIMPPGATWPKPVLLVDGATAGAWRIDGARVVLEPFEPLPRALREEAEAEARRLEAVIAG